MKRYFFQLLLTVIITSLSLSTVYATNTIYRHLTYQVFEKNTYVYSVDMVAKIMTHQNTPGIGILTTINGEKIYENNFCFLLSTLETKFIQQTTWNTIDDSMFIWKIDATKTPGQVEYKNIKTHTTDKKTVVFPKNGYSLQGLIYVLQRKNFKKNTLFNFKLLIPQNKFINMYAKRINTEKVTTKFQSETCYKLEIGLHGILSFIAPKYHMWITCDDRHIPIKYQDHRYTYLLSEIKE